MNVIEININDKKDYISKFNKDRISKDLYKYILNEVKLTNIKERITIKINSKIKLTDKEKEQLAHNIKKTSKEEKEDIEFIEDKMFFKDSILLLLGIITIIIYFILKDSPVISEIILIIGWLFIWEAIDSVLFSRTENKIKKQRLNQIITSNIDFK